MEYAALPGGAFSGTPPGATTKTTCSKHGIFIYQEGDAHYQRAAANLVKGHHAIDEAVYDLEASAQPPVDGAQVPLVSGPNVRGVVLKDHVADLEKLNTCRHLGGSWIRSGGCGGCTVLLRHGLVVVQGLEEPRQEGRAHHLVLLVRRVQQPHRPRVHSAQVGEIFRRLKGRIRSQPEVIW